MVTITPFLWFNTEGREAAEFYTKIFKKSRVIRINKMENTPSGTVETVDFELLGVEFNFMSAGPFHKINPSVSFVYNTTSLEEADFVWTQLLPESNVLMEFGEYPFADKFGWLQDKFGVSWQVNYSKNVKVSNITTNLMFVGKAYGKAEEALNHYMKVFKNASKEEIKRYEESEAPEKKGLIKHADFTIEKRKFSILESGLDHKFFFNESMSFVINCTTQEEIDYYWDNLSADEKAEQCGWLKDKYGVSWQVVPIGFSELLEDPDKEKVKRKVQAFLKMKKIDIKTLEGIT